MHEWWKACAHGKRAISCPARTAAWHTEQSSMWSCSVAGCEGRASSSRADRWSLGLSSSSPPCSACADRTNSITASACISLSSTWVTPINASSKSYPRTRDARSKPCTYMHLHTHANAHQLYIPLGPNVFPCTALHIFCNLHPYSLP